MEFLSRSTQTLSRRIGILPGSFNPPTVAHTELICAAKSFVDEVVCTLPRSLPHKQFFGATYDQRVSLLQTAARLIPFSIARTNGGLYLEIAREFREAMGPDIQLDLICGQDAAERIIGWDYGRAGAVDELLGEFELLVAPRERHFEAPEAWRHRVHVLPVTPAISAISSTLVRERIAAGEPWRDLVPEGTHQQVAEVYSRTLASRNARSL